MNDGVRFDPGSRKGHVESYFLKINDPKAERAVWVKATILAALGKEPVAESWVVAFERGKPAASAKSVFEYSAARFAKDALDVTLPNLSLSRESAKGALEGIAFDLALSDTSKPLLHYPHPQMYSGPFPSTKMTSPMPDLRARGHVKVGTREWDVDGWRGLLGHNWGRGHAFAYAWGHCNVWNERDDVVFEGASARVRVGPALLPTGTVLVARIGPETHAINRLRRVFRNRASMTFRRWQFSGRGPTISVRGEMWADTSDMVGLHYENPGGAMTYCLNSKLASARVELITRGGSPLVLTSRAAALEIGTRDAHHGVEMVL
jgi:hypothetical protein